MDQKVKNIPKPRRPDYLTLSEIEAAEGRYLRARNESDLSALAILAVEMFPALIKSAKRSLDR